MFLVRPVVGPLLFFVLMNIYSSFPIAAPETFSGQTYDLAAENARLHAELHAAQELAFIDHKSGLLNERGLAQRYAELKRGSPPRSTHSAAMIDIDKFKHINERVGHLTGDALLGELGSCLLAHLGSDDIAGRQIGDGFVVLMPNTPLDAATERARAMRDACDQVTTVRGKTIHLSVSAGVGPLTLDGDLAEATQLADQALYHAKLTGRARTSVWSPDLKFNVKSRSRVQHAAGVLGTRLLLYARK